MNVYNTVQKTICLGHQGSRDGNVTAAIKKAHNPALQRGFSEGGKKSLSTLSYVLKEEQ